MAIAFWHQFGQFTASPGVRIIFISDEAQANCRQQFLVRLVLMCSNPTTRRIQTATATIWLFRHPEIALDIFLLGISYRQVMSSVEASNDMLLRPCLATAVAVNTRLHLFETEIASTNS